MGCDIHLYREKKIDGIWVSADEWTDEYGEGLEVPYEDQFSDRDYNLFGFLAGVRTESEFDLDPTGVPKDVCENIKNCFDRMEGDAHSASSLSLEELKWHWANLSDKVITVSGMKDAEGLNKLARSIMEKGETEWDLIYPYCQGTNQDNFENFSIEVPCHFKLSRIETLISLFDDIDAEECRIVFWFDS
jgi:hypothetical protein